MFSSSLGNINIMNGHIFKNISNKEFNTKFDTEEKCLNFLAEHKWKDGFVCRKCQNTNYCTGRTPYSRRCTRCKHDESAKVGTIFEGCRFPLTKAFYIAFTVCNAQNMSSHELSRRLGIRQMTCWTFKKKLTECVQSRTDLSDSQKIDIQKILLSHI